MMFPKMTKFAARRGVGAIIVQHILFLMLVKQISSYSTLNCIWKGITKNGEILDHNLPDQPSISMIPHNAAVTKR